MNDKTQDKNVKKSISILVLLVVILAITIGFAIMSGTLNIVGTSSIYHSTWDVHFAHLVPTQGSVTPDVAASIDETDDLSISYTVTLNKPGEYYEFTVDVVNGGNIDAELIELPTVTGVSAEQDVYVNYSFTHTDGTPIQVGEDLNAGSSRNFTVRVEFDNNVTEDSQLPKTLQTLDLDVVLNYQQK